jgi:hypothetical protein
MHALLFVASLTIRQEFIERLTQRGRELFVRLASLRIRFQQRHDETGQAIGILARADKETGTQHAWQQD